MKGTGRPCLRRRGEDRGWLPFLGGSGADDSREGLPPRGWQKWPMSGNAFERRATTGTRLDQRTLIDDVVRWQELEPVLTSDVCGETTNVEQTYGRP